jgi:hypothetical protein
VRQGCRRVCLRCVRGAVFVDRIGVPCAADRRRSGAAAEEIGDATRCSEQGKGKGIASKYWASFVKFGPRQQLRHGPPQILSFEGLALFFSRGPWDKEEEFSKQ